MPFRQVLLYLDQNDFKAYYWASNVAEDIPQ